MRRETAEIVVDLFCGGGGASEGIEPRELATAQGFRRSYDLLDGTTPTKKVRRRLSKASQIERIGNSVPPQLVAAVVRANITGARRQEAA